MVRLVPLFLSRLPLEQAAASFFWSMCDDEAGWRLFKMDTVIKVSLIPP